MILSCRKMNVVWIFIWILPAICAVQLTRADQSSNTDKAWLRMGDEQRQESWMRTSTRAAENGHGNDSRDEALTHHQRASSGGMSMQGIKIHGSGSGSRAFGPRSRDYGDNLFLSGGHDVPLLDINEEDDGTSKRTVLRRKSHDFSYLDLDRTPRGREEFGTGRKVANLFAHAAFSVFTNFYFLIGVLWYFCFSSSHYPGGQAFKNLGEGLVKSFPYPEVSNNSLMALPPHEAQHQAQAMANWLGGFIFTFTAVFYLCHHAEIKLHRVSVPERVKRYIWTSDSWMISMRSLLSFFSKIGDIVNASVIMWSAMFLHGLLDETFSANVVHVIAWPLLFMTVGYSTRHYFLEWPRQDSLRESTFTTSARNKFLSWVWAWQMLVFTMVAAIATVFVITQAQPVVQEIGDRLIDQAQGLMPGAVEQFKEMIQQELAPIIEALCQVGIVKGPACSTPSAAPTTVPVTYPTMPSISS